MDLKEMSAEVLHDGFIIVRSFSERSDAGKGPVSQLQA